MSTLKPSLIELCKAMAIAIRQNQHDMVLTGEELRMCEKALNCAVDAIESDDVEMYGAKQNHGVIK